MIKRTEKEQGMTLLEVMVALVIFSTAALALMNSVSLNVRFTGSLGDTLQASWVAENQLAQAQLAASDIPESGLTGVETMGGRQWNWRIARVKADKNTFADDVQVYADGQESQPVVAFQLTEPGEVK